MSGPRPGEQVGHPSQAGRPWPVDPATPGFVTRRGRLVHHREDCPGYQQGVRIARERGRTVHPVEWTTTGDARVRRKEPCSACWPTSGVEQR